MENKLFHFFVQLFVWVGEEGKGEPGLGCILCAHEHILCRTPWIKSDMQQQEFCTSFRIMRSMATLFSCKKEHRDSTYQRCLLQSLVSGFLQLWPWVSMVLKQSIISKTVRSRPGKALITTQTIWCGLCNRHEDWCCGVSLAKMHIPR